MTKIYKQITDLIGHTPLVELPKYSKFRGVDTPIIGKVEYFNPGGSVKDRIALAMIEDTEKAGKLKPGATIIEPTSGNTGVGLALVAAVKGYRLILTMPETMSVERRSLVKAYGAQVKLTSGKDGMKGAIKAAEELRDSIEGSIILGQYLKEQNPNVRIVAVEPTDSAVLSGGNSGPHKIQGIGAGFIPDTYNSAYIDEVFKVENDQAILTGRLLAQQEGLLVGISSGAAAFAATEIARRPENKGKQIVTLFPDTGERYLSTVLYAFDEYPL